MIINATPHKLNFYKKEQTTENKRIRKLLVNEGENPFMVVEPSGKLLNAAKTTSEAGEFEGVPLVGLVFTGVDNPLAIFDLTLSETPLIVVSNLYASAHRECLGHTAFSYTLVTVGDVVYSGVEDPKPCGCASLVIAS